jgi:hypothetical protein
LRLPIFRVPIALCHWGIDHFPLPPIYCSLFDVKRHRQYDGIYT